MARKHAKPTPPPATSETEATTAPRRRGRDLEPGRPVLLEGDGHRRWWWTVDPDDPALLDDDQPAATLIGHGGPPHTHLHRHRHGGTAADHRHLHDHDGEHAAEVGHSASQDPDAVDWWRPEEAKPSKEGIER